MRVDTVMTSPVLSVTPDTAVGDAARLMLSHRISGLPVVEVDGTLVGMVSEGDFLRRGELGTERKRSWWLEFLAGAGKIAEDYVQARSQRVGDVMSTEPVTTTGDATLEEAVALMIEARVKRLPVMKDGKLVGIIARSDLMRAMVEAQPARPAGQMDDARIRAAIAAELDRQAWERGGLIRVNVKDGNVELNGAIFNDRVRDAARVAVENVPGVRSVTDNLVWIEPMSGYVLLPADREKMHRTPE